jgi:predicted ester cyclase
MSATNKQIYKAYIDAFKHPDPARFAEAVAEFFTKDAVINVSHPINDVQGSEGFQADVLAPMLAAFDGLYRREDILIAGSFEGHDWVSSTGYLVGTFARDWLGIKATGKLAYVHVGEFHKMRGGKAVESYIYIDFPEFLMLTDQWPRPAPQGLAAMTPGPATHDGIAMGESDPERTASTLDIVENMLRSLATKDEAWRPYWHQNMMWYGPAAFGSFVGIEEFKGFQVPFEAAFEGWGGGLSEHTPTKHFTRFADGDYACIGGWPSLQGTHIKPYLGIDPTGTTCMFRVCDWYRREGDLLVENWVFVDIPDLMLQLGYDLFGELNHA